MFRSPSCFDKRLRRRNYAISFGKRIFSHWQSLRTRSAVPSVGRPPKTVLDCFSGLIELPENVCKPKRQGIVLSCWQREQNFWLFIVLYRSAIFRSVPNGRKAANRKILYLAFFFAKTPTNSQNASWIALRVPSPAQLERQIDFLPSNRSRGVIHKQQPIARLGRSPRIEPI